MRERSEMILKIVCGVLVGLLFVQLAHVVLRTNPLRGVRMPELPTLPASLAGQPAVKGTNNVTGPVAGTNAASLVANPKPGENGTNSTAALPGIAGPGSNTNATNGATGQKSREKETNSTVAQISATTGKNAPANPARPGETNLAPTQASRPTATNSNSSPASDKTRIYAAPGLAPEKNDTNAVSARTLAQTGPQAFMAQPGMTKMPELPPNIQARIDKIVQSEILAAFMRPMPMALLGIAGQDAFLRAPSGQTGLLKAGDELGGIKLIRIGINRVLIEQAGEQKELTIFSGLGSESLLPKPKPATNETIIQSK